MKAIPFECEIDGKPLFCLANDWKKDEYRYSLELSQTETPQNTILVVGVNPGGKTDPEKLCFGSTVRCILDLVFTKNQDVKDYDSVLLVNLTPAIAQVPSDLNNNKIESYHKDNIEKIQSLIQKRKGHIKDILFCFGTSFKYGKELFPEVIRAITKELPSAKYWCLGLSRKGYPIHPLARVGNKGLKECKLDPNTFCHFSYSNE